MTEKELQGVFEETLDELEGVRPPRYIITRHLWNDDEGIMKEEWMTQIPVKDDNVPAEDFSDYGWTDDIEDSQLVKLEANSDTFPATIDNIKGYWETYRDDLTLTPEGWRVTDFRFDEWETEMRRKERS